MRLQSVLILIDAQQLVQFYGFLSTINKPTHRDMYFENNMSKCFILTELCILTSCRSSRVVPSFRSIHHNISDLARHHLSDSFKSIFHGYHINWYGTDPNRNVQYEFYVKSNSYILLLTISVWRVRFIKKTMIDLENSVKLLVIVALVVVILRSSSINLE